MSKAKKVIIVLAAAAVLALAYGGYNVYAAASVEFDLVAIDGVGDPASDRYYAGYVASFAIPESIFYAPYLDARAAELDAYLAWEDSVRHDLSTLYQQEQTRLYVTETAEVRDGKTVFTYGGEVTENGETRPYHEEFTLNWTFATNEELAQIQPVQSIPAPTA